MNRAIPPVINIVFTQKIRYVCDKFYRKISRESVINNVATHADLSNVPLGNIKQTVFNYTRRTIDQLCPSGNRGTPAVCKASGGGLMASFAGTRVYFTKQKQFSETSHK
jgi:hypothetical protein